MYKDKKVIIVGGSGFIGTQLAKALLVQGAQVVIVDLKASPLKNKVFFVQSDLKDFPECLEMKNPFVIFNLAGAPIFGRWTPVYKELLYSSRIKTTHVLVRQFKNKEQYKPEFFVSTSAIGIYGDRGVEMLEETSELKITTFLSRLAREWELKALKAKKYDVNVRIIRNAHVLGKGGILGVLQKIFSLGIGGTIGSGEQYMSFVSVDACVQFYLDAPFSKNEIQNAVTIEPITNKNFSKILASILHRPLLFRIPLWTLRFLYGEFAKEIATSQRVYSIYTPVSEKIEEVIADALKK